MFSKKTGKYPDGLHTSMKYTHVEKKNILSAGSPFDDRLLKKLIERIKS